MPPPPPASGRGPGQGDGAAGRLPVAVFRDELLRPSETFVRDQGFDRMVHIHFDNDRTVYENGVATIVTPAGEE